MESHVDAYAAQTPMRVFINRICWNQAASGEGPVYWGVFVPSRRLTSPLGAVRLTDSDVKFLKTEGCPLPKGSLLRPCSWLVSSRPVSRSRCFTLGVATWLGGTKEVVAPTRVRVYRTHYACRITHVEEMSHTRSYAQFSCEFEFCGDYQPAADVGKLNYCVVEVAKKSRYGYPPKPGQYLEVSELPRPQDTKSKKSSKELDRPAVSQDAWREWRWEAFIPLDEVSSMSRDEVRREMSRYKERQT